MPDQISAAIDAGWAEADRQRRRANLAELRAIRAERLKQMWEYAALNDDRLAVECLESLARHAALRKTETKGKLA